MSTADPEAELRFLPSLPVHDSPSGPCPAMLNCPKLPLIPLFAAFL